MRRTIMLVLLPFTGVPAHAQVSLSDQINAVSASQDREQARQDAIARAAADQANAVQAQQRAQQIHQQHRNEAVAKEQREEARSERRRGEAFQDQLREIQIERAHLQLLQEQQQITTDKQRDQAYEDKLRELALQQKALEIKQFQARVARENDIIDHDLKSQDANTDVIQSHADATRSISDGLRASLEHAQPDGSSRSEKSATASVKKADASH
jgi:hypothetical protein